MSVEYVDTNAKSGDGANQLLTKILQRLNWSSAVQPGIIPANVAITNTPLPVTWTAPKLVTDQQLVVTNALLQDIDDEIDQMEADLIAIHAHQTSIDGKLTATNLLLAASEAHLTSIDTNINTVSDGVYLRDYVGGHRATVTSDGHLSTVAVPLGFEIAHEGLYGTRAAQAWRVMGRRVGFNSSSVLQDVGEFLGVTTNLFPVLTGAETLEVVSSSVQDDTAGTGTRTIRIIYLNTSYAMTSVNVVLDGTTPVNLGAIRMLFVFWMEALTGGTSEVAVGNIDLRIAATGAVQERISAGGNRSLSARFMVPDGYEAFIPEWNVSTIGTSQDVRLRATVSTDTRALCSQYIFQDTFMTASDNSSLQVIPYLKIPARAKIKVSTLAGATGTQNKIHSAFTLYLVAL